MKRLLALTVTLSVLAAPALAERAPDDKGKATHVVTGTVEKVYTRRDGRLTEYLVQVRVQAAEKGDGYKDGDRMYVACYRRDRSPLAIADDLGHAGVPKEGDQIKAWVHRRAGGRLEGNFPAWFEAVKEK